MPSYSASSTSSDGQTCSMPALLMRMSRPPRLLGRLLDGGAAARDIGDFEFERHHRAPRGTDGFDHGVERSEPTCG